ncbi:flagellar biosynthetic protein FliO [Solibacillus sp. R5-41]|uniref:flagellar biosynthetic protein FliO n=1 Tax=Solibacillus sp. R5-41 TaxID=2048654 RepID=UPI0020A411DC|nr:flagellar biosynthetic protein FliO [Solibacillus sp. R5-41]
MLAKLSFRFWVVIGIIVMSLTIIPSSNGTFASVKFLDDCMENPEICQEDTTSDDETEASDSSSVGMGFWEYIKILIALVFVLGLLLFVLKFLNKRNLSYQQNSVIRNIGGMSVGPQKSVQIVQISNQIYVLGVGEDIQLIKEISAPEDVERLLTQFEDKQLNASATPYIAELFNKFSKKNKPTNVTESPKFNEMFNERIDKIKQERSEELERWKEQESDKQ